MSCAYYSHTPLKVRHPPCISLLTQFSITSWNDFETAFTENFGDDKSPIVLVLELSMIQMDSKEKFKDFNQRFMSLINKILATSKPTNDVSIEFYTSTLPVSMAMFVKRDEKATLEEIFKEAIKVEKDMLSLKGNLDKTPIHQKQSCV